MNAQLVNSQNLYVAACAAAYAFSAYQKGATSNMTTYENLIQDFPTRCGNVWRNLRLHARPYEVTFMLMTTASGLVIPFERLKDPRSVYIDSERYTQARKQLEELRKLLFHNSIFWQSSESSWIYDNCTLKQKMTSQALQQWVERQNGALKSFRTSPNIDVDFVLSTIRNGLAHGGVASLGDGDITTLTFSSFSEETSSKQSQGGLTKYKYRMVRMNVDDFSLFLEQWFDFCKGLKLPEYTFEQIPDDES